MNRPIRYAVIDQPIGFDTIRLNGFGGAIGDPTIVLVKVDGWTRLEIVAPTDYPEWPESKLALFQDQARQIAKAYPTLGDGRRSILFFPEHQGTSRQDDPPGEYLD